jgi:oxygen-independent coproporphyrinogen III oxidase
MNTTTEWPRPKAAYIHIPFCESKCGYCDFASVANADSQMENYLVALEREIESELTEPQPVDSIFVGGGTPTWLPEPLLDRVLAAIRQWFPGSTSLEWTVEANPNTLSVEKVRLLAHQGVNRVSLGAQTFSSPLLAVLERTHDPDSIEQAIGWLAPLIPNLSIDLIFGIPGQRLTDWERDLSRAATLPITHVSNYGLTYEKGTKLWREWRQGKVTPIANDLEADLFAFAMNFWKERGWKQYEISNYASPRSGTEYHECRHNLVYWRQQSYWGFGCGAARFVDGVRSLNARDLNAYLSRVMAGESPTVQSERLTPRAFALEMLLVGLRLREGLDPRLFHERTGFELVELLKPILRLPWDEPVMEINETQVRLTNRGVFIADSLFAKLWENEP